MTEQQRSFNPDRAAMEAVSSIQAVMAMGKFGAQKSAQIQDIIADTIRAALSHAEGEAQPVGFVDQGIAEADLLYDESRISGRQSGLFSVPVYTHPAPSQQPVSDPGRSNKQVGCEREDGTLNIHDESKTCAVCAPDERKIADWLNREIGFANAYAEKHKGSPNHEARAIMVGRTQALQEVRDRLSVRLRAGKGDE